MRSFLFPTFAAHAVSPKCSEVIRLRFALGKRVPLDHVLSIVCRQWGLSALTTIEILMEMGRSILHLVNYDIKQR